jgi:hypothetical protein
MTRGMQRIEKKLFINPIRKDDLQASTRDRRFDPKLQELCNTVASEADRVNGRNIAEQQLRVRIDLYFLTALTESPFVGTPGFRVSKINQTMIALPELGGVNWAARLVQIGRRSYGNDPRVEEFSGYKRGWTRLTETDGKIKAFSN